MTDTMTRLKTLADAVRAQTARVAAERQILQVLLRELDAAIARAA